MDRLSSLELNNKGDVKKYTFKILYICFACSILVVASHIYRYNINQKELSGQIYSKFSTNFDDVLQRYYTMIYGVRAVFSQNPEMSLSEWTAYSSQVFYPKRYPGINNIFIISSLDKTEVTDFVQKETANNHRDFQVHSPDNYFLKEYNVIKYMAAQKSAELIGLNVRQYEKARNALDQSRDENKTKAVFSEPFLKSSPKFSENAFIFFTPIYFAQEKIATVLDRRKNFVGWISVPITLKPFFDELISSQKDYKNLNISLSFPPYEDLVDHDVVLEVTPNQDASKNYIHKQSIKKRVSNLDFEINISRSTDQISLYDGRILIPYSSFFIFFFSLFVSALITAFIWSLITMRQRALNLANQMTTDLFRQEQKYRTLIQNAPGVIFSCEPNRNWRMNYLSDQFRDITGYDPKEFLDNKKRYIEIVHPEDISKVEKIVGLTPKVNHEYFFDYRIVHANGSVRWMHERAKTVRTPQSKELHLTGHFFDITDQKNKEAEYRNLVNALENAVNGVAYINPRGYHLQVNESYTEIVATKPHLLQYKSIFEFFNEKDQKRLQCALDNFDEDVKRETVTLELTNQEGKIIYVQLVIVPAYSDSVTRSINGYYIFAKDVSRDARREHELANAVKSAEAANQTKSTFLATMSHELRTPLNAIIGYSDMLMEDAMDDGNEVMLADLKKINTSGRHLLTLINDILDVSKLEAGKMTIHLETFDIKEIAQSIVDIIYPSAEKNNNVVELIVDEDIGNMYSDLTKIRQMVFNLLSNACKFTKNGTVTLTIESNTVANREFVAFAVKDTGLGIKPESMNKLFQPFAQADSSTTRNYGGTGLGLTITKKFTEMLGGNICFSSEYQKGTEFSINIPRNSRKDVADKYNKDVEKTDGNVRVA